MPPNGRTSRNYLLFASIRLGRPTSGTNCAFLLATPINHTYQCHALFPIPLRMLDLKTGRGSSSHKLYIYAH